MSSENHLYNGRWQLHALNATEFFTAKWLILYYVNFTSILKNGLEGCKWMYKIPFTEVQMRHDHLHGDTGDKETEPQDVFGGRPNKS